MPIVHDLDRLLLSIETIIKVIRLAQEPSNVCSFVVRRSELGKIRQRLRTIYQVITESNGGPWIILRNEANNLLEFFERLRERKLFSSPSTNFLADASEGNTLSGIKLGSSLVETRQQRLLFRG